MKIKKGVLYYKIVGRIFKKREFYYGIDETTLFNLTNRTYIKVGDDYNEYIEYKDGGELGNFLIDENLNILLNYESEEVKKGIDKIIRKLSNINTK